MALSSDLIKQFAKITNDNTNRQNNGTTAYGTVVEYNGQKYVQLDGSELLTPVNSTVSSQNGDRVTVTIKDHTATVYGNLSDPSASGNKVSNMDDTITEFGIILANKATIEELNAEIARINSLEASDAKITGRLTVNEANISSLQAADVEITGRLTTNEANIKSLQTDKLDASTATITYATIKSLEATDANLYNLTATYGEFEDLTTRNFAAVNADIDSLNANKLDVKTASITYATIDSLNASNANISNLQANVGKIDTLMFGSASGSTIQTSFANAVIAQLGNAQIKSAMIESVSANKIVAGDIITNNVRVMSEDGKLLISDETIQISDKSRVRVQIGKDAAGDYSINIWDTNGKLMFSEGGITDSAIKDAIIRNDMVSDSANISASKLDISSLFDVINNDGSHTLKSSKIYVDANSQTLDVAFTNMTTKVNNVTSTANTALSNAATAQGTADANTADISSLTQTVTTQGTNITAIQGQISSKIWQSDITTAVNNIEIGGRNLLHDTNNVKNVKNGLCTKTITDYGIENITSGGYVTVSFDAKSDVNTNIDTYPRYSTSSVGYPSISKTFAVTTEWKRYTTTILLTSKDWVAWSIRSNSSVVGGSASVTVSVRNIKLEMGTKATDWTPAPEDFDADITTLSDKYTSLDQTVDGISATVASHTTTLSGKADSSTVTAVTNRVTSLEATATGLSSTVSSHTSTLANKADKSTVTALTTRVSTAESNITQLDNKIAANVTEIDSLGTRMTNVEATADGLTSTVSSVKTTADNAMAYALRKYTVDISGSSYDVDTFYPVIGGAIPSNGYRTIQVNVQLNSGSTPSWSTHANGFTCNLSARMKAHGWGTSSGKMGWIDDFHYQWCDAMPAYISQMTNSSRPVLYLRGGGKYFIYTDYATTWTPYTTDYTVSSQTVSPTTSPSNYSSLVNNWTDHNDLTDAKEDVIEAKTIADSAESRVSIAETIIQQLSDAIATLVVDGDGSSLMTQTSTGWQFDMSAIQSAITSNGSEIDTLNNTLNDTNNNVNNLQQIANTFNALNTYVKIGTYNSEPCIELGKSDSEFKLLITNTQILFMQGSNTPAYLTNQKLYINQGIVEDELQIGSFVWKKRSNGNTGLVWKGATS